MASLLQVVRNAGANNAVILGAWRTWLPARFNRFSRTDPMATLDGGAISD
ncbi:MAG: hypothetical protein ACR2IV_17930 [Bryobacteraceae bacterium]